MGFAFRSDAVEVGDRVVARREYASGVKSDVIGHVQSLDPLVIRPQQVGGYPSDKEAVEIAPGELKIIKKLSPRTIRNSDIRHVEEAIANAYTEAHQRWSADGQWLMRASGSVPLGPSAGFTPMPATEILDHAGPRLLLPERIGKNGLPHSRPVGPELVCYVGELPDDGSAEDTDTAPAALGTAGDDTVWVVVPTAPASAAELRDTLRWGRAQGATRAVVVLEVPDAAARAIAAECGLDEHHRRRFATL